MACFSLAGAYVVNVVRFNSSLTDANNELISTNHELTETVRQRDLALQAQNQAEGNLGLAISERDDALFDAELKAGNLADYQSLLPPCLDPIRNASRNPNYVVRDYSDDIWDQPPVVEQ